MKRRLVAGLFVWAASFGGLGSATLGEMQSFEGPVRLAILSHGPWPPVSADDSSNRWSRDPAAIELGALLFGEVRLSANGAVSCANCHDPVTRFQDGRQVGRGLMSGVRNTPSLMDAAGQRWYGWDGASDSLWSAALRALLAPHEMGHSASDAASLIRTDTALRSAYIRAFGKTGLMDEERLLVNLAKALAAWQGTVISPRTAFDHFRDALVDDDAVAMARYPAAAKRGLRLFIGEGRCHLCHAGPRFSNGEFADTGLPHFLPDGGVDSGRHGGLLALQASPFTRLGHFADDAGSDSGEGAVATRHVRMSHRNFGEFKVPSLRGLVHTAPYMHNGSLPSLPAVLKYYNELDEERLHADGERILRPLGFSASQLADLEAFLRTLSN